MNILLKSIVDIFILSKYINNKIKNIAWVLHERFFDYHNCNSQ